MCPIFLGGGLGVEVHEKKTKILICKKGKLVKEGFKQHFSGFSLLIVWNHPELPSVGKT